MPSRMVRSSLPQVGDGLAQSVVQGGELHAGAAFLFETLREGGATPISHAVGATALSTG